jgi:hypothetical protein
MTPTTRLGTRLVSGSPRTQAKILLLTRLTLNSKEWLVLLRYLTTVLLLLLLLLLKHCNNCSSKLSSSSSNFRATITTSTLLILSTLSTLSTLLTLTQSLPLISIQELNGAAASILSWIKVLVVAAGLSELLKCFQTDSVLPHLELLT